MSVEHVKKALHNFATTKDGRAIVLKGKWGTGKTYIWESVIKAHRSHFHRASYSYVSLFGLTSLADVKRAIFTNTVKREKAGDLITKESVAENLKKADVSDAVSLLKRMSNHVKDSKLPYVGGVGGLVESIQFATLTNTLICIDDYERRSNSLSGRDVLGLISNLVVSKQCSVILILNDNSLKPDDEFFSFSEKVFDYEVEYNPKVRESIEVVFPSNEGFYPELKKNIERLGINNLRLMKKIDLFYNFFLPHIKNAPVEIVAKALLILPLAIFSVYGGNDCPADIDFIKSPVARHEIVSADEDASAESVKSQNAILAKVEWLNGYGYYFTDEFDAAIIALVEKGYTDDEQLELVIIALEDQIQHNKDMGLLTAAWDLMTRTFTNNEVEVVAAFEKALAVCEPKMDISDVDDVCWFYSSLGMDSRVTQLVDTHFALARANGWYVSKGDVNNKRLKNPLVLEKLEEHITAQVANVDVGELMERAYRLEGFVPSVFREFKKKSPNDFYLYFKGADHPSITDYIRNCLQSCDVNYSDAESNEAARHVFLCTYSAIKRLSTESRLNMVRFMNFREFDSAYQMYIDEVPEYGKWA